MERDCSRFVDSILLPKNVTDLEDTLIPKAPSTNTHQIKPLIFTWVLALVLMAFLPSRFKQKKALKGEFDVLECTKVDVGITEQECNLPPGYRFSPNDGELVMFYLFNKLLGRNLPLTDVVKEIDIYEHDPDQLPIGDYRHGTKRSEAFYFSNVERVYGMEGKATKRTTKGGYWKVTSEGKKVTYGDDEILVGFKTSMLFNKGHGPAPRGTISSYIMHEYRVNPSIVPVDVLNDSIREKIERLVVCRIVNKEKEARQEGPPSPVYKIPPEELLSHEEDEKSS